MTDTNTTSNEQLSRLARSNAYLGKDRDQLREIILDRDEEIAQLSDTLQDAREINYESEVAGLVTENKRLQRALSDEQAAHRGTAALLRSAHETTAPQRDWRHIANEWADMATNGIQWLRNIRDGVSTPIEALTEMEANLKRIQVLQHEEPSG